jgi:GntR family transcriptional regulator, arabinose operon transcriptional repressor
MDYSDMKAKYLEVKDYVHDLVQSGKHGERLPSENELRRRFTVSHVTVRRALEILEHSGLLSRMKGKGAFINKPKKKVKAYHFLTISHREPDGPSAMARCIREIIAGAATEASRNECFLDVMCIGKTRCTLIEECRRLDIDGVIGMLPYHNQYDILEELRQNGIPVIAVNRILKNSHLSYICPDPVQVIRTAASRLIENGRRRIAYLPVLDFNLAHYYLRGYHQALSQAGITPQPELIMEVTVPHPPEAVRNEVLQYLRKILKSPSAPDALIITGGILYYDLFELLDELNIKTPDDLEVVMMVDSQVGIPEGVPRKNQVHEMPQPFMTLGKESIKALLKAARGEVGRQCIELPFEPDFKDFK